MTCWLSRLIARSHIREGQGQQPCHPERNETRRELFGHNRPPVQRFFFIVRFCEHIRCDFNFAASTRRHKRWKTNREPWSMGRWPLVFQRVSVMTKNASRWNAALPVRWNFNPLARTQRVHFRRKNAGDISLTGTTHSFVPAFAVNVWTSCHAVKSELRCNV